MSRKGLFRIFLALLLSLPLGLVLGSGVAVAQPATGFTADFPVDDCTFARDGGNDLFVSLHPGDFLRLEGEDDGETVVLVITALNKTRTIKFRTKDGEEVQVKARIVEERETVDGELVEVSRNFFARCVETNDVYYFGENVDIYEDGEIVSHDGAWLAGKAGALPGIIMPGTFLLGSRYFQEIAPGVALDRGENTTTGLEMDTPAGLFKNCVEVIETSPLEPGHESRKVYCPDVGLVIDSSVELVDFERTDED